jgi:hypothetical protein
MIRQTQRGYADFKPAELQTWKDRIIKLFGEENVRFRDSGPIYTKLLDSNENGPFFHPPKFSHHVIEALPRESCRQVSQRYMIGEYNVVKGTAVMYFDDEDVL